MSNVFAVVVNWNQKEVTKKCVDSLLRVAPFVNVVVVDNDSFDNSFSYLKEVYKNSEKVLLVKTRKNLGFGGGANRGIKIALKKGADFVLILNNDTLAAPDFIEPLLNEFKKDDKTGIVSPKICYLTDKNKIWYLGGSLNLLGLKILHNHINKKDKLLSKKSFETDFASGCAMMVKKRVFKKIGLFKEKYFMFWEDADFSFRTRRKGFKIKVAPRSKIFHTESKSISNSFQKIYYLTRNGLIFARENYPVFLKPWLYIYFVLRFINNALKRIIKPQDKKLKAVSRGLNDFIKHKSGELK